MLRMRTGVLDTIQRQAVLRAPRWRRASRSIACARPHLLRRRGTPHEIGVIVASPRRDQDRALARQRFRHLVADEGDELLSHLAAQVPGLRRVPGADEGAKLDGASIRVDYLDIDHLAVPELGLLYCFFQPTPDPRHVGTIIDMERNHADQGRGVAGPVL